MRIIFKIVRVLYPIGAIGVIGLLFNIPYLHMLALLGLLCFCDPKFYHTMRQIAGSFCDVYRTIPRKEGYNSIVNYILPFDGRWTVVNGGVDKDFSHSWDVETQRFAYDFIKMDDNGNSHRGDETALDSYYCYGLDVRAPADGVVVKASRNHIESRVNGKKAYCDTWDIRGNFVVIKHAEKEYSALAHLAAGSVVVRAGDFVKQGQIIGKCGNTGNTSQPHLHFQLQSGKSFFTAQGLPIAFSNVEAREKPNYGKLDSRPRVDGLQRAGLEHGFSEKFFIGRGLEVENGDDDQLTLF